MEQRDRAEGWKHAKISGHVNEDLVTANLKKSTSLQKRILSTFGKQHCRITDIKDGGLHETNVECILGNTTKSKTDLKISLDDNSLINISIKKSLSGQVFLIGTERFLEGFQLQYETTIPENVKYAMRLFWGAIDVSKIIDGYSESNVIAYEKHKNRITAQTLKKFDLKLYQDLISWFNTNISNITDFCFSKGLSKNEDDWANLIWYKNNLHENDIDELFTLSKLKVLVAKEKAFYGTIGGGTTIQLPFGFVQWHQGKMQFHHNFNKIWSIGQIAG